MILHGEEVEHEPSKVTAEGISEDQKSASESKKGPCHPTDCLTELVEHNYAELVQKAKDRENQPRSKYYNLEISNFMR